MTPRLRQLALLVLPAALLLVPTAAQAGPFQSPSANIGCFVNREFARCDIRHKEWKSPPKPKNCELDWGFGAAVDEKGKAGIVCAGDTALGQGPKLGYGKTIEKGPFACKSLMSGVRCKNGKTGHGFFISRQSYKLF